MLTASISPLQRCTDPFVLCVCDHAVLQFLIIDPLLVFVKAPVIKWWASRRHAALRKLTTEQLRTRAKAEGITSSSIEFARKQFQEQISTTFEQRKKEKKALLALLLSPRPRSPRACCVWHRSSSWESGTRVQQMALTATGNRHLATHRGRIRFSTRWLKSQTTHDRSQLARDVTDANIDATEAQMKIELQRVRSSHTLRTKLAARASKNVPPLPPGEDEEQPASGHRGRGLTIVRHAAEIGAISISQPPVQLILILAVHS